jgi:hypothetical protein
VPWDSTYRPEALEFNPDDQSAAANSIFEACGRLRNLHWSGSPVIDKGRFWWIRRAGIVRHISYETDYEDVVWPE